MARCQQVHWRKPTHLIVKKDGHMLCVTFKTDTMTVMVMCCFAWKTVKNIRVSSARLWNVDRQISLCTQQTDRCNCGMRIKVDHVHIVCRFVKALWALFAQPHSR